MKDQLDKIERAARSAIQRTADSKQLQEAEHRFLGRKSEIVRLTRAIKDLPAADRPVLGALANSVRRTISQTIVDKKRQLDLTAEPALRLDPTLPACPPDMGHLHPLSVFLRRIVDIFRSMGFDVAEGPEVEKAVYHFDQLNIPKNHPARDLWDTFYVPDARGEVRPDSDDQLLMRAQTSPVQLRYMKNHRPPVRVIMPGRVFRHEATDASHESNFYQCEGLVIDRGVSVAHMIGTLRGFLRELFAADVLVRLRPSYFPFVEPGFEVDMSCLLCDGRGCSVCKQSGWLELLGAGLVHPKVLRHMKLDPNIYSGFAFGLGVDRLLLLHYGIPDVRLLYAGDLRFIKQWT